jgi:hypothetical protein
MQSLFDIFQTPKSGINPTLHNIVDTIYKDSIHAQGPWIAGGMGRQLVLGESNFADIDIWFNNSKSYEQCRLRLNNVFGDYMYETFTSDNAITYTIGDFKVQLIRRAYYTSIDEVFANFDFTCCQIAIDKNLKTYGPGIEDAKNYVLKLNKLDCHGFLARYAKYVGYSYVMPADEFLNIINHEEINYEFDPTALGY